MEVFLFRYFSSGRVNAIAEDFNLAYLMWDRPSNGVDIYYRNDKDLPAEAFWHYRLDDVQEPSMWWTSRAGPIHLGFEICPEWFPIGPEAPCYSPVPGPAKL